MKPGGPSLAVFKFASCDGCQLSLLNLDAALLALVERFDVRLFREATSREREGPFDLGLVEGSITTAEDAERIRRVREQCRTLIAIGACATSGGIQWLRELADVEAWKASIYPEPARIAALPTSTPISDHVRVDHALEGCPISGEQLLRVLTRALLGAAPDLPRSSVCMACKRAGHVCVLVTRGTPCMGPVTRDGCGALCPGMGRDCYACFGPMDDPNPDALVAAFERAGLPRADAIRRLRHINGRRPAFRDAADRLADGTGGEGA
jgi:coenzyme F420-reducing hydrogenase gamma subunit